MFLTKKFLAFCLGISLGSSLFSQTPSKPFGSNLSYANGIMQNYQTPAQASALTQTWYTYWKTNFTKSCGQGKTLAVNDYNGSNAYSEGQGYGLLIAAYMGDKTLFDELWKGFKDNRNSDGVMHWTVSCGGVVAQNGATDGDLDAAMGLLVANKQWPNTTAPHNYSSDATALITAIKDHEFTTCNGATVQKPGDKFGGCDCTNPSYYAVGYYRAFGKHVTSQASFWDKAASDGLALLLKATNPSTGLNPAWTDQSGSITSGGNCNVVAGGGGSKTDYQFDASRTPWRIVVDYLWWGTPDSKKYLDKIEEWANGKGISNIVAGFTTSGSNIANYKNSAFTGAFAIGAMATNQTQVNGFYNWWVNNSTTEGNVGSRLDDKPYFQNTLRVMYALVASGNFWNPYSSGSGTVTPPPASVVTISLSNPANNSSFVLGSPVNIEASASSTQGATIVDVEFIVDGVTAFSDKTAP
ncbi:MAG: hypothetical protein H7329_05095, partial [Opitutaceae bacterium]|nr:hypothetical protein [Cytophagales bacterium]